MKIASFGSSQPRLRALSFAIALALPLAPAWAAPEADVPDAKPEAQQADAGGGRKLEEVTVTAQRREEDVQKVPIAITTVSDERLDAMRSGADDIRFMAGRLPSLNVESSFGRAFPRFYIRGLGNTDFDLNASQPVSLIYDEVVQENPILKGFPVFDLDRVEMLRGPQGTLFGRNTPAGVIKFESRKPTQEFEGYGRASYASFDTLNIEGAVSGGLGENVAARASMIYQQRDDWVDNTVAGPESELEGFDEFATRLQLGFGDPDGFNGLLNWHLRSLDGTARLFRANIIEPGSNEFVDDFDIEEISIDGTNFQELDSWGASARLGWNLGRTTLFSVTGYETVDTLSRGDIDGGFGASFAPPFGPGFIPFPAESADGLPDHKQFTQEFRLESNDWGRFDWQAGFYYFYEDITVDSFNYDTLAGGVQNGYAEQKQENTAWALFVSGEYDVSDNFVLRGGLRYTDDEKEFEAQRFVSPFGAPPTGILRADPDDSDVSGDISGVWTVDDDLNFYARVARGFRAPSVQGRLLFGDTISVAESETVLSFEAGVKADLFEDRTRVGFNLFNYRVNDQQLTAVGGQTNFNTLINADRTNGYGMELDLESYVTDNFLVTFGASYNNTEIDDPNLAVQPCGSGCTVLDPDGAVDGTVSIDGNSLPQAPEWIWNLTARYGIQVGQGELYFYTDWAYRDEASFFLYESAEYQSDSLLEGGLRVGYQWSFGQYDVALFGRNITDEIGLVGGIDFNNLTGFVNEPRLWGVEFSAKF
ncbi:MAG: TonB-dependent receptor [Xanthomonadales bacterium]|nr:TonB-dependent receptor [Xanthomonadales bacterium]HQX23660.1 TonB-dependent receptor [Pseudomonadota bacterium]